MELMSNKFHCNGCGKPVTVRDYEQVIEWGKKCADCRVERVTGGIDEMKRNYVYKNLPVKKPYSYTVKVGESDNATTKPLGGVSLRRETPGKKKKKVLTTEQKRANKDRANDKWSRECINRSLHSNNVSDPIWDE